MQGRIVSLRIISIAFTLKFKCRMRIEHNQQAITSQVESRHNVFQFDKDIRINTNNDNCELSITLLTQKGSKYSGGNLKLFLNELYSNQGKIINAPLTKCIDKQAFCQLQIYAVEESCNKNIMSSATFHQQSFVTPNKTPRQLQPLDSILHETKSERNFNGSKHLFKSHLVQKQASETARKYLGSNNLAFERSRLKKPSPNRSLINRQSPQLMQSRFKTQEALDVASRQTVRAKRIQQRLKEETQKFKAEQQKRKCLQSSQKNIQFELIRLRAFKQQSENELTRKNNKINELSLQLNSFKNQENKNILLQKQIEERDKQILFFKDKVKKHKQEASNFKNEIGILKQFHEKQLKRLNSEIQKAKQHQKEAESSIKRDVFIEKQEKLKLEGKVRQLQEDLQRQKDLSKQQQNMINQTIITFEKNNFQLIKENNFLKENMKQERQTLTKQKDDLNRELKQLKIELENEKNRFFKFIGQRRISDNQLAQKEVVVSQFKRQIEGKITKIQQLSLLNQRLKQQNTKIKKKYEVLSTQSKRDKYQKNEQYQKALSQLKSTELRLREVELRFIALQSESKNIKNQNEVYQRKQSQLAKQLIFYKQKEKHLRTQLHNKQSECLILKGDVESLNHRLKQKQQQRIQVSQSHYEDHLEDQKMEKMINLYETQQKVLQMELLNQKQLNSQLSSQIYNLKQASDKHNQTQTEWRQEQKFLTGQNQKINQELSNSVKQIKQLQLKLNQYEHKIRELSQKIQKEKKYTHSLQEKIKQRQSEVSQLKQDLQMGRNALLQIKGKYKTAEDDVDMLKAELDYFEEERKKYVKQNEQLEFEVRSLKDQLSLANMKIREQSEKGNNDQKKYKEQIVKYENKIKNVKAQSDKFKETLRSIIIEFNNQHQDSQSSFFKKRKEQKPALTLTNQLLFKLEQILKQMQQKIEQLDNKTTILERDITIARQQNIIKDNQNQSAQSQLKGKVSSLFIEIEQMKNLHEQKVNEIEGNYKELQWNYNCLIQQNKGLKQLKEHLSTQLNYKIQALENAEKQIKQLIQAKTSIDKVVQESQQQTNYFSRQTQNLQKYCTKLQEQLAEYEQKEQQWFNQKQSMNQKMLRLSGSLQGLKKIQGQLNQEQCQIKQLLGQKDIQIQELKVIVESYHLDFNKYQQEKSQRQQFTCSLLRQKQELLRQYLDSQKRQTSSETIIFQLNCKIQTLEEEKEQYLSRHQKLKQMAEQSQRKRKLIDLELDYKNNQLKKIEEKNQKSQVQSLGIQQNLISLNENLKDQNERLLTSLKKVQTRNRQNETKVQMLLSQNEQAKYRNAQMTKTNEEIEKRLKKEQIERKQLDNEIKQNISKIIQLNQAIQRLKNEIKEKDVQALRFKKQCEKIESQLSQKDLINYELSSQKYMLESASNQQLTIFEEKIAYLESQIIKYQQLSANYETKLSQLQTENNRIQEAYNQLELDHLKLNSRVTVSQEQIEAARQSYNNLKSQFQELKQNNRKMQNLLSEKDVNYRKMEIEYQQRQALKQKQHQKFRTEIDGLHHLFKKYEQQLKQKENHIEQITHKLHSQAENARKYELSLRKLKEENSNNYWNLSREVKKAVSIKMRAIDLDQQGKQSQILKGLQDSIMELLRRFSEN